MSKHHGKRNFATAAAAVSVKERMPLWLDRMDGIQAYFDEMANYYQDACQFSFIRGQTFYEFGEYRAMFSGPCSAKQSFTLEDIINQLRFLHYHCPNMPDAEKNAAIANRQGALREFNDKVKSWKIAEYFKWHPSVNASVAGVDAAPSP